MNKKKIFSQGDLGVDGEQELEQSSGDFGYDLRIYGDGYLLRFERD